MMRPTHSTQVPRIGMLATVRNRRGIVSAVEPFDGSIEGQLNLVTVEYTDAESPSEDQLIWEREPFAKLLEATALPDPSRDAPMVPEEFDALVRATRWTALSPFLDPDGSEGPLTRFPIRTSRILLVQHRDIADLETGGSFTVKKFDSGAVRGKDTTQREGTIFLRPLNPTYQPIELNNVPEDEIRVIAEFLEVLNA